jgi:hypothetical protein
LNKEIVRVFRPSIWLLALNAVFFVLLFLKFIDYRYEYAVYRSLYNSNKAENGNQLQTFKNLVALTNLIQNRKVEQYKNLQGMVPLKTRLFRSGDMQLLDGTGACGNYAHVLAELCITAGMEARIAQLTHNGKYGSHMITEAKVNGR